MALLSQLKECSQVAQLIPTNLKIAITIVCSSQLINGGVVKWYASNQPIRNGTGQNITTKTYLVFVFSLTNMSSSVFNLREYVNVLKKGARKLFKCFELN